MLNRLLDLFYPLYQSYHPLGCGTEVKLDLSLDLTLNQLFLRVLANGLGRCHDSLLSWASTYHGCEVLIVDAEVGCRQELQKCANGSS